MTSIPSAASTAGNPAPFAALKASMPILALAALLGLMPLSAPAAAAGSAPLTVEDVAALLEAGIGEQVVLKHLAANGARLELTVESLLALRRAGASDAFLEALVERNGGSGEQRSPSDGEAPAEPAGPFRVYYAESDSGERVLHLTNLDESGRRIGGEVEPSAPRNVIAPREEAPVVDRSAASLPASPPVMINILPPANPDPYVDQYEDQDRRERYLDSSGPFAGVYARGRYPGFYGFVPRHHGPRHSRRGPVVLHNPLLASPPGSYSHFLQYHQGGHSRAASPYTRATAAQRNKALFRKR